MAADFIVIGDVLMDYHLQVPPYSGVVRYAETEKIQLPFPTKIPLDSPIKAMSGGNAYNVSMALAKLGVDTQIYTEIGNDGAGEQILKDLQKLGVNTELVVQHQEQAGTNSAVILGAEGDRVIFTYHYPRDYQLPNLSEAKYVYLTSVGEDDQKLFEAILRAKMHGNFQLMFSPGSKQLREEFREIAPAMAATDVLLLNKDEAQMLIKTTSEDDDYLVKTLADQGPKSIVMTKAGKGSVACSNGEVIKVGALPVEVIDTTGAGDTFSATVCAAISQGRDLKTAMEWGAFHAANVVQGIGCENYLLDSSHLQNMHAERQSELVFTE